MDQKSECVDIFNICTKMAIWKGKKSKNQESSLTVLLASLLSFFLFFFTLKFSKHGCNGGKEEETSFAFRITPVFVHACKACCRHSSIAFARRMGEVCNIELGLCKFLVHLALNSN
jgi:hypothetical protein